MTDIVWLGVDRRSGARVGRAGKALIAEWPGLGRLVATSSKDARFVPVPGADPTQCAKIADGPVIALIRSLDGKLALHAAAVRVNEQAVAFVGDSGAGKSTLAAAMCRSSAAELLADDVVLLENEPTWSVLPSDCAHFLDAKAFEALHAVSDVPFAKGKHRLSPPKRAACAARLSLLLHLTFDDEREYPLARDLSSVDALEKLIPQTIRFAIDDAASLCVELERLTTLVSSVPIMQLTRPPRFDALGATVHLVRDLLCKGHP